MTGSNCWLRWMCSVLVAIAVSASAFADEPARSAGPTSTVVGPKGATLLRSPSDPLVAFRVVLAAGSQDDPPGKEGLAALTASMVAEGGSKSLTYQQILAAFYPMAATLEGSCYKEMTTYAG